MSEPKRIILPDAEAPMPDEQDDRPRQRARTMSRKEMARQFRQQTAAGGVDPELQALMTELEATRPKTRGDCVEGAPHAQRPCPYVSCKYNLYVDVNPRTGSVKMNFPDKELWELSETCALDVADRAGITLEEVGVIMNLTRERVRQLEMRGLAKLRVIADDDAPRLTDDDDE